MGNTLDNNLVNKQEVLDVLKDKWGMFSDANDAMQESIDTIKALQPVTPQPKMGKWKIDAHRIRVLGNGTETHDYSVHCDRCHYGWDYTTDKEGSLVSNFCPNCGAKMEGDKNG